MDFLSRKNLSSSQFCLFMIQFYPEIIRLLLLKEFASKFAYFVWLCLKRILAVCALEMTLSV